MHIRIPVSYTHLDVYKRQVFVKLFGLTPFVYRLPNALMGIATLVIFYLLLKRLWGRKAGYIGLLLLVFTLSLIHIYTTSAD